MANLSVNILLCGHLVYKFLSLDPVLGHKFNPPPHTLFLLRVGYGIDDRSSIPIKGWDFFLLATMSRLALRPTQPPHFMDNMVSFPGRSVKPTTYLHLVPKSRMRGAIPPLLQYAFMVWYSVKVQGQLYSYLLFVTSAPDGGGWSVSRPSGFTPGKIKDILDLK